MKGWKVEEKLAKKTPRRNVEKQNSFLFNQPKKMLVEILNSQV